MLLLESLKSLSNLLVLLGQKMPFKMVDALTVSVLLSLVTTSAVVAINWEDDEFGGQVKWAFNCDFDSGDEDNQVFGGGEDNNNDISNIVQMIGQQPSSSREDCGWLCWADVRCHYFSHSQSICRTMTTKKRLIKSNDQEQQTAVIVPFLADSDTVCGYVPSRVGSLPINSTFSSNTPPTSPHIGPSSD